MPTISLPEPLHAAAEARAAQAGFRSADEYVADLLRRDLAQQEADPTAVALDALTSRKREIELLLVQGLDSGPAAPMTAEDWQEVRQEVRDHRERRTNS